MTSLSYQPYKSGVLNQGDTKTDDMIFNQYSFFNQNPTSLKGKLQLLEDLVTICQNELLAHRRQLQQLKNEKLNLETNYTKTFHDINAKVANDIDQLDSELKRSKDKMDSDVLKIKGMNTNLKNENQTLKDKLDMIDKRITALSQQVGNKESNF